MKITLKTIVLVALLIFYLIVIGSNFIGSGPIRREGLEDGDGSTPSPLDIEMTPDISVPTTDVDMSIPTTDVDMSVPSTTVAMSVPVMTSPEMKPTSDSTFVPSPTMTSMPTSSIQ